MLHFEDILCCKEENSSDRYKENFLCTKLKGHTGKCGKKGTSNLVFKNIILGKGKKKLIKNKVQKDPYMTPGGQKSVRNREVRIYDKTLETKEVEKLNSEGKFAVGIRKKFSSTPEDCYNIDMELISQLLNMEDLVVKPNINDEDMEIIEILRSLYEYPLVCPICKEQILISQFQKGKGFDDYSIQIGHINPPSNPDESAHYSGNVRWIHRKCNMIQGDMEISKTIDYLEEILKKHGRI